MRPSLKPYRGFKCERKLIGAMLTFIAVKNGRWILKAQSQAELHREIDVHLQAVEERRSQEVSTATNA